MDDHDLFSPLDLHHTIDCPHCGEPNALVLDPAASGVLIQDCEVCCRPYRLHVGWDSDVGAAQLRVEPTE